MLSVRATEQNYYWEVIRYHEVTKVECTAFWEQVGKQVNYKTTVQASYKDTEILGDVQGWVMLQVKQELT